MYYEATDFLETAGDETLRLIARARELAREYSSTDYGDHEKRESILRELLGAIGENVSIDTPFHCNHGKNIFLGSDVVIGMNCTFVDDRPIRVGNKVLIASDVQICTASHPVSPAERLPDDWQRKSAAFFRTWAKPVVIHDGVWIGAKAVILPSVTIGENAVIGAGSVVNRDIPASCVAVGNPCRVIRRLEGEGSIG